MTDLDLRRLRANAIEARDGALIGGVRTAPLVFCTVHWQVMLALCDAATPTRLNHAAGLHNAARLAGELNHALAYGHDRNDNIRLSGRLVRQLHDLTERTPT